MGFASYTENIIERLLDAQSHLLSELGHLRANARHPDSLERKRLADDVKRFRAETETALDTIERSIANVFGDLLETLRDPNFRYAAKIKKLEIEKESARNERNEALLKRDKTRKTNAQLIQERDDLRRENAKLAAELRALKKEQSDMADWTEAVKGVKRRRSG